MMTFGGNNNRASEKKVIAEGHICGPGSFSFICMLYLGEIPDIPDNKVNSGLHKGQRSWEVTNRLRPFLFSVLFG